MLLNGGPKGGFKPQGPKAAGAKAAASGSGTAMMLQKYIGTFMVLIATFLETLLLIIFMYYAYDITATLVSMSEYLDSYEDRKGYLMVRLHPFSDVAAKRILEHTRQIISSAEGDIQRVYARIVEKYVRQHGGSNRKHSPEEATLDVEEPVVDVGVSPEKSTQTMGLLRSLWPAELLMRRDLRGREAKTFRRVYVIYALFAIFWMFQVGFALAMQAYKAAEHVLNREYENLIPLVIIILHTVGACMTMYVFCESLAPLGCSDELMGPDKSS